MHEYFHSTRFKIKIARLVYLISRILLIKQRRIIRRGGVFFEIDLAEGIDLSLFLFGNFQKHISESVFFKLPVDAVIFDIGANFGALSLPLANKYSQSMVYAFEPTHYAFSKLQRNIQLNKKLANRIKPVQLFFTSKQMTLGALKAFSSWRLDSVDNNRHPVHLGIEKEATAKQTTIDSFAECEGISNIHFIKIDTDGHELEILKGAISTLERCRPVIVFELSTYLLIENSQSYSEFEQLLLPLGYILIDGKSGRIVSASTVRNIVPAAGSTDIIALPQSL